MALDAAFTLANLGAATAWLLLLLAPRARLTRMGLPLVASALLSIAYVALASYALPAAISAGGGFGSLDAVATLLNEPAALLAGWLHYLAFDLFVGAWISADATQHGHSRLVVAPILILTFLAGPAGFLAYLLLRTAARRQIAIPLGGNSDA